MDQRIGKSAWACLPVEVIVLNPIRPIINTRSSKKTGYYLAQLKLGKARRYL